MIVDFLTRVWKLISLAALWLLSASVLAGMLFVSHGAFVEPHSTVNDDWAYAFTMFAGGLWLLAAFGRISWTMAALRDGLDTYGGILKLIGFRFVAGSMVCIGAAAGSLGCRWLDPSASRLGIQCWFIAGGIAGLVLACMLSNIHQWRVRERFEK